MVFFMLITIMKNHHSCFVGRQVWPSWYPKISTDPRFWWSAMGISKRCQYRLVKYYVIYKYYQFPSNTSIHHFKIGISKYCNLCKWLNLPCGCKEKKKKKKKESSSSSSSSSSEDSADEAGDFLSLIQHIQVWYADMREWETHSKFPGEGGGQQRQRRNRHGRTGTSLVELFSPRLNEGYRMDMMRKVGWTSWVCLKIG